MSITHEQKRQLKEAKAIALMPRPDNTVEVGINGLTVTLTVKEFKEIAQDKDKIFIFRDAVNDRAWLQRQGTDIEGKVFDVTLADSLLTAGLKLGNGDNDIIQRYLGKAQTIDTQGLLALRTSMRSHLKQQGLTEAALIEFEATQATAMMQNKGVRLNVEWLKAKQEELQGGKDEKAQKLRYWFIEQLPHREAEIKRIDWASENKKNKAVILSVMKEVGIPLENSLSKDALKQYAPQYPILNQLIDYRSAHYQQGNNGINGYLKKVDEQGYVYPTWNQNEAATGRMSATKPAIQNLSRDLAPAIIPSNNKVFVRADYSQVELRILAEISGDKTLIEGFQQGKDPHSMTASKMLNKPESEISSDERKSAKPVNFGEVYGQTPQGLKDYARSAYGVEFTLEQAEAYQSAIAQAYPQAAQRKAKVKTAFSQQWNQASVEGELWNSTSTPNTRTLSGRRRLWQPKPVENSRIPVTEALNAPIQGTSADITKVALANIARELPKDVSLVMARHDEIVLECPPEKAEEVGIWLNQKMVEAGQRFLKQVPIETDVEIVADLGGTPVALEWDEFISRTDALIQQLGWNQQESINYLQDNYGVKSRLKLTDEQVFEFMADLEDKASKLPKPQPQKDPNQVPKDFDIRDYLSSELAEKDTGSQFINVACPCCRLEGKDEAGQNLGVHRETGYFNCNRDESHSLGAKGTSTEERQKRLSRMYKALTELGYSKEGFEPSKLVQSSQQREYRTYTPEQVAKSVKYLWESKSTDAQKARQWLLDRGIDRHLSEKMGIGFRKAAIYDPNAEKPLTSIKGAITDYSPENTQRILTQHNASDSAKLLPSAIAVYCMDATDGKIYRATRNAPWLPKDKAPSNDWTRQSPPLVQITHNPPNAEMTIFCEGNWDAVRLAKEVQASGKPIAVAYATSGAGTVPPNAQLAVIPTEKVAIFYDLDDAGAKGASKLQSALQSIEKDAVVATVPHKETAPEGYDVRDALDAGFTVDDLLEKVSPEVNPPSKTSTFPEVSVESVESDPKTPSKPLRTRLTGIVEDIDRFIEDDIRVSSQIFGLAADSIQKNQELLEQVENLTPSTSSATPESVSEDIEPSQEASPEPLPLPKPKPMLEPIQQAKPDAQKSGADVQEVQQDTLLLSAVLARTLTLALMKQLKGRDKENKFNINRGKDTVLQINVNGKVAYKGKPEQAPEINDLSVEQLDAIAQVLDKNPSEQVNLNQLDITLNGKTLLSVKDGVVQTNDLSPEMGKAVQKALEEAKRVELGKKDNTVTIDAEQAPTPEPLPKVYFEPVRPSEQAPTPESLPKVYFEPVRPSEQAPTPEPLPKVYFEPVPEHPTPVTNVDSQYVEPQPEISDPSVESSPKKANLSPDLTPLVVHEFSRQLLEPKWSESQQQYVSTGFEREIGLATADVPGEIQDAIHGGRFQINDNYPPKEPTVMTATIGQYSVLAVASPLRDDADRPLVGYRYFWLTNEKDSNFQGLETLQQWWEQKGQPHFELKPHSEVFQDLSNNRAQDFYSATPIFKSPEQQSGTVTSQQPIYVRTPPKSKVEVEEVPSSHKNPSVLTSALSEASVSQLLGTAATKIWQNIAQAPQKLWQMGKNTVARLGTSVKGAVTELTKSPQQRTNEQVSQVLKTATSFLKDKEQGKAHQFTENGYAFQFKDNTLKIARPTPNGHEVAFSLDSEGFYDNNLTKQDYRAIAQVQQALDPPQNKSVAKSQPKEKDTELQVA